MAVITISRETGSAGDQIADLLCQELGYQRVGKAIISQVAQEAGVDVEAVLAKETQAASRARLISSEMTSLYRKQPGAFEKQAALDDATYARILQQTMEQYAQTGRAIIVGRGGQMALRDWPTAVHVRLYAPLEVRIPVVSQRFNISPQEAQQQLKRSDEQKRQYIRAMYKNAEWTNLKYYHLAINTAAIPPEIAAQMIILAAQNKDVEIQDAPPDNEATKNLT